MADPAVPIYDVTNDGQRFIMIRDGGYTSASTITVVENWFEEFREPAPPAQ
jgi:hypothetical protein